MIFVILYYHIILIYLNTKWIPFLWAWEGQKKKFLIIFTFSVQVLWWAGRYTNCSKYWFWVVGYMRNALTSASLSAWLDYSVRNCNHIPLQIFGSEIWIYWMKWKSFSLCKIFMRVDSFAFLDDRGGRIHVVFQDHTQKCK